MESLRGRVVLSSLPGLNQISPASPRTTRPAPSFLGAICLGPVRDDGKIKAGIDRLDKEGLVPRS
jgi:hypothetical protein